MVVVGTGNGGGGWKIEVFRGSVVVFADGGWLR